MPANEPVVVSTAIVGLVTAGLSVATAFGLSLSTAQQSSVLSLVTALIVIAGFVTRSKVTPKPVAQALINKAWAADPKAGDGAKPVV